RVLQVAAGYPHGVAGVGAHLAVASLGGHQGDLLAGLPGTDDAVALCGAAQNEGAGAVPDPAIAGRGLCGAGQAQRQQAECTCQGTTREREGASRGTGHEHRNFACNKGKESPTNGPRKAGPVYPAWKTMVSRKGDEWLGTQKTE